MIQLRNMARLGINLFPRTRRSYFRYNPGSGCAVRQGFKSPSHIADRVPSRASTQT
jgi:hypothetical protein